MFDLRDLFQWERFITPSIIKIFYWLSVGLSLLFGLAGILGGVMQLFLSPFGGLLAIFGSVIGILIGVIFARIIAEYVLIMIADRRQLEDLLCAPRGCLILENLPVVVFRARVGHAKQTYRAKNGFARPGRW